MSETDSSIDAIDSSSTSEPGASQYPSPPYPPPGLGSFGPPPAPPSWTPLTPAKPAEPEEFFYKVTGDQANALQNMGFAAGALMIMLRSVPGIRSATVTEESAGNIVFEFDDLPGVYSIEVNTVPPITHLPPA